jgi:hypothetical protein
MVTANSLGIVHHNNVSGVHEPAETKILWYSFKEKLRIHFKVIKSNISWNGVP